MISGIKPDSVKGKSSAGHFCEQIPFCPARDANLSPTLGFLWRFKGFKGIRYVYYLRLMYRKRKYVKKRHSREYGR